MTTTLVNASKHDGVMVLELNAPPANGLRAREVA